MLKDCILREVGALSRCIQSISDIKFKELNLQKGQYIFLTRVCENPGINLIDLSNILKVDKTTTTKAVQKLIESGYIIKNRDNVDKRIWHLYPTDSGLKIYALVIEEENSNIQTCFSSFTANEEEEALKLLKKMRENIESHWKEIKNL